MRLFEQAVRANDANGLEPGRRLPFDEDRPARATLLYCVGFEAAA